MKKNYYFLSIFILLIGLPKLTAQVEFEAKVSKNTLGLNERLRVDFIMNEDGDNFNPPSFDGFTVVGGPNQSVSHSWVNGKRSFSKTYSYFLTPKNLGTTRIEPATIEIKGETYTTAPVTIKVTKAIQKPKNPNDPNYIANNTIHLVAEISKTNPYINEAITVVYKLYVSPKTGVSNSREIESPRYNDFWSQEISTQNSTVQNGTYKGEKYRYIVLRKTVLYPQKTGKLEIEPLKLDVTVDVPTNRRDIFGMQLSRQVHRTISAGTRTITVKPLPEKGKPADFTGAVGNFNMQVTTTKEELNATDSFEAIVTVSGNGNLKLFELPKITVPNALEVYEPENNDAITTNLRGMQGTRKQSYTIVPQHKGKYPIPSVSFSYFDLKTETYKTLKSKEIIINVLDNPNQLATSNDKINEDSNKQKILLSENQFAYIKTTTKITPIQQKKFFKSNTFWSLFLLPIIAIPIAIVYRKKQQERKNDITGNKIRKADRLAKKYLSDAKKNLGNKEAFYIALEKALHNYLKAILQIETAEFSKEKISKILQERNVDAATINEFITILKNCELARYTPITQVEMQNDYDRASKTIAAIDKQIK